MKNTFFACAVAVLLVASNRDAYTQAPPNVEASVDQVFAKWSTSTPGCAVGVAVDGKPVLTKAYGMADLEHDVRNLPDTIFEAGSVSKQFTAAAILLLAKDGKLSLDDPARKYIPELPDYGTPLTIRHMLHHQSGLRDWGSVEAIAGWPRTTREYTHDHVLDIVSRQEALNFKPGTQYSYSNTGFNLAAIIVSRVSGMPFADFTAQRIFTPLGMRHTSWRDDHTRIVKGRSVAYSASGDGFHTEMPFENVYGNGGLLTTVGDLLKWNENFDRPVVGDAALVAQEQEPGKFADGHEGSYAFGLMVGNFRGLRKVDHSGSTAGYRAHLSRFPDEHTSVAVLCNVSSGNATGSANAVAEIYLAGKLKPAPPPIEPDFTPPAVLLPAATLNEYAGNYWSDEAEVMFTIVVDKDQLALKRRPATTIALTATGKDAFRGSIGTVIFIRDAAGKLKELSVRQDRVFDLRFQRRP
ncbi:MAG: serine hydrolase domain-containing protein [Vicinamibacterales bacterium]